MKRKRSARVIVTYNCNRNCPGCCNNHGNKIEEIEDINDFLAYDEIIITGGEPLLLRTKILDFISNLKRIGYDKKIYLYTSFWEKNNLCHQSIINMVNGITYTLHAEANDKDIIALRNLSNNKRLMDESFNARLIIDKRCYNNYDFSNINFKNWSVIRKLQWKDVCEPASNEDLVSFLL